MVGSAMLGRRSAGVCSAAASLVAATSHLEASLTFTNATTTNGLGSNAVHGVFAAGGTVYAGTDGGLSIGVSAVPAPGAVALLGHGHGALPPSRRTAGGSPEAANRSPRSAHGRLDAALAWQCQLAHESSRLWLQEGLLVPDQAGGGDVREAD